MMLTPIQSIGDGPLGGDALDWLLNSLVAAWGGEALFGLMLGAIIFTAFYIAADGNIAVPVTALLLTGTVFVEMLPPQYQSIAGAVVLIGLASGLWTVIKRYVLSGVA